jgi:hypothetical protein
VKACSAYAIAAHRNRWPTLTELTKPCCVVYQTLTYPPKLAAISITQAESALIGYGYDQPPLIRASRKPERTPS